MANLKYVDGILPIINKIDETFNYYVDGNPDNKKEWLIDEEAAKVVRRIFSLCVEGFGPTQIAKRLKADKVLTPTEYWDSIGRNCSKPPATKYGWCADTVANILFIVGMIVLIAFTNLGPVLIYGLVKLSDVAKTLIAYFWLKKEKWLVNLTIQPK